MPELSNHKSLGFWAAVGGVMALLKLKERHDELQYQQVPDEENVRMGRQYTDEDGDQADRETLLSTDPVTRPKHIRKKGCCVCCGMDCGLFWKAFGIVLLGIVLFYSAKLIFWATTPGPTGLENMPKYSESLGCMNAPHIWLNSTTHRTIPVHTDGGHVLKINGAAPGTIYIASASADINELQYEVTVRSDNDKLLRDVLDKWPKDDSPHSQLVLSTPNILGGGSCMRYDIVVKVPKNLRKLHIMTHPTGPAHIKLAEGKEALQTLDSLFITQFGMVTENLILSHKDVRANTIKLESRRGYITGSVSITEETKITTQEGDAIVNLAVEPYGSIDMIDTKASLMTLAGTGRSDYTYQASVPKRQVDSVHRVQNGGDIYLTYKKAQFSGPIDLDVKSFSMSNVASKNGVRYVGEIDGEDKLEVHNSGGWLGLYF